MLEERRVGLERYLQLLASLSPAPPALLSFLGMEQQPGSSPPGPATPVLGFLNDPVLETAALPDLATQLITSVTLASLNFTGDTGQQFE